MEGECSVMCVSPLALLHLLLLRRQIIWLRTGGDAHFKHVALDDGFSCGRLKLDQEMRLGH